MFLFRLGVMSAMFNSKTNWMFRSSGNTPLSLISIDVTIYIFLI